jgi:cytochrome P450
MTPPFPLKNSHETTSSSFTWVTYLLALHPDIQTRLRAEIHAALPVGLSPSNNPDFDIATTLESLPLLNGVCSEGLRVLPSVPVTVRTTNHDTTLLDQPIAAGTRLIISPWAINKSPTIWGPGADEFKPERWIDSETGKPNQTGGASTNYAIMTFLHGPRSCIGQGFARAELRALVAAFVAAFEWTMADHNEEVIAGGIVTTKPKDGLRVKLTKARDW